MQLGLFFQNVGEFLSGRPLTKPHPAPPPQNPPPVPPAPGLVVDRLENSGRLVGDTAVTLIGEGGSKIISNDGASLITNDGGSVISNDGASLITNDGGSLITNDGGSRPIRSARHDGVNGANTPGFVQTGGEVDLNHFQVVSSIELNGGTLTGSGLIVGNLINNAGFISPGHSTGRISITGDFMQGPNGTSIVESRGLGLDQTDQIQVSGTASLSGNLHVKLTNGFVPSAADMFNPLAYGAVTGSFSSTGGNAQVTENGTGTVVTINPAVAQPQSGQSLNISTRMKVLDGANVLIGGFIVSGPSGSNKRVLIRAIGPSLANFGVPGTLSDPLLEFHQPDGSVVTNDDWQQGDPGQIPGGLAPSDPRESVVVATLTPGAYTAVVKGAHGETGVGLVEGVRFLTRD